MDDQFEAARIHREELDREIDAILTERVVRSASHSGPGFTTRVRAGMGRTLISLGTSLVGTADAATAAARATGSRSRV